MPADAVGSADAALVAVGTEVDVVPNVNVLDGEPPPGSTQAERSAIVASSASPLIGM